jgi:hypothetical protein
VVHFKRGHFHAIIFINHTFLDLLSENLRTLLRKKVMDGPYLQVKFECFQEFAHHALCAGRPPNVKGFFPSAEDPGGEPEVGDAYGMIGMKVGEKQLILRGVEACIVRSRL